MLHIGIMGVMGAMIAALWSEDPLIHDNLHVSEERAVTSCLSVFEAGLSEWSPVASDLTLGDHRSFDLRPFRIHANLVCQQVDLVVTRDLPCQLAFFYGVGGCIKRGGSNAGTGSPDEIQKVGVRVPVGLSYTFKQNPVELFAQVVPLLDVTREPEPGLGVGIGARYYFNL